MATTGTTHPTTTTPVLTLAALALMLEAARIDAYSQGYKDAQPVQTYAEATGR